MPKCKGRELQVRNFPLRLRNIIKARAKAEGLTMGQWIIRACGMKLALDNKFLAAQARDLPKVEE